MTAISMWQPWASLWLSPAKVHETRSWPVYRDWENRVPFELVVHAAKKKISDNLDAHLVMILEAHFGKFWREKMPMGAIIGTVTITSSFATEQTRPAHDSDRVCGIWSPKRFAWRRGDYHRLANPIPYRGKQGIFNIPDDILQVKR